MKQKINCANQNIRMSRKIFFSSAHLYKQPEWSRKKNLDIFGKCFSNHGHGHNYTLEIFFKGQIHPRTGLLVNLIDIDPLLKTVTEEFDHKHINFDHPHFKDIVPTTENIAVYFWSAIRKQVSKSKFQGLQLYKIKLFEDPELFVEVSK